MAQLTADQSLAGEIVSALAEDRPRLPTRLLYDTRGSELFERICEQPEYYLTRAELEITRNKIEAIAQRVGPVHVLAELGSGNSQKTRLLLDHLDSLSAYVPIDIADDFLYQTADQLQQSYPYLDVIPLHANFLDDFQLPELPEESGRTVFYFPGSTIGNLTPPQSHSLLHHLAHLADGEGGLLMGIDLQKETRVLEAAYNDAAGVTAEFTENILHHLRATTGAVLQPESFRHHAFYNADDHRMEIELRARRSTSIQLYGERFEFRAGDAILVEFSHKFSIPGIAEHLAGAGWTLQDNWQDEQQRFAVIWATRQG